MTTGYWPALFRKENEKKYFSFITFYIFNNLMDNLDNRSKSIYYEYLGLDRWKKITFVVTPILFLLWAYFSRLITRIPRFIINLIIFYIFFGVILCLILIAHIAGPSALLIIFSPFKFLLYKPISLILISLFTFGFNFCSFKLNKIQLARKELVILYFSFFSVPILMFLISCIFNLIKANHWIIGFLGFNNMDSIL